MHKQLGGLCFRLKLVLHVRAIFHCNSPRNVQFHSALSQSSSGQWLYAPVLLLRIPSSIHSIINLVRICFNNTLTGFLLLSGLYKNLYISIDIVFCHKLTHIKVGKSAYFTLFLFFLCCGCFV